MEVTFNSRYIVYDNGEVWSKDNLNSKNQYGKSRLLKQRVNNSGYYEIRLYDAKNKNTKHF